MTERKSLAAGKLPAAKLGVNGTILSGGAPVQISPTGQGATRPTIPSQSPALTHGVTPTATGVPAMAQQPVQTNIAHLGPKVRSTNSTARQAPLTPTTPQTRHTGVLHPVSPLNPNQSGIIRSSSQQTPPPVTPPTPVPQSRTRTQQVFAPVAQARLLDTLAGRAALAAFLLPFISLLAFIIDLAVGLNPVDETILFASALIAIITGIVSLRSWNSMPPGKTLAQWGISLATCALVAEVIRLIIWHN